MRRKEREGREGEGSGGRKMMGREEEQGEREKGSGDRKALFLSWTKIGDGRTDKFHIRVTGENLSRFDRSVLITSIPLSVMKNRPISRRRAAKKEGGGRR